MQLYYGNSTYYGICTAKKQADTPQKQLNFQCVDFDQYVKSLKPKEDDTNEIIKHCTANPITCTIKTAYFFGAFYISAKYHLLTDLAISVPNLDGYFFQGKTPIGFKALAGVKKHLMGTTGTTVTGSLFKRMTTNTQDWMKDASLYQGSDKTLLNPAVAFITNEIPYGKEISAAALVIYSVSLLYSNWDLQGWTKVALAGGSFAYCTFSSIDSKKPWNEALEKAFFKCTTGITSSLITGVSLTHQLPKPDDILGATFKSGTNQHTKSDQYYGYWVLSKYYTGNNVIRYIPEYIPKMLLGIDAGIDILKLFNNPNLKNSFELAKSSALAAGFYTGYFVPVAASFMILDFVSTLYEIPKVYNEDGGFVAAQELLKPIGVLSTFGLTIWYTPALAAHSVLTGIYISTIAVGAAYDLYSLYQEGFHLMICNRTPEFIQNLLGYSDEICKQYQLDQKLEKVKEEEKALKEMLKNKLGEKFGKGMYEKIYKPYFEYKKDFVEKVHSGEMTKQEAENELNEKTFAIQGYYDMYIETQTEENDVIYANCTNESQRFIDEVEIHDGGHRLEVLNTYNYSETLPELGTSPNFDIEISPNYLLLIGILII